MSATKRKTVQPRNELYALVDALPAREVPAARRYLEYLRDMGNDPVLEALRNAPFDDEPETPEEAAVVQEAREQIARGEVVTDAEIRRMLGI